MIAVEDERRIKELQTYRVACQSSLLFHYRYFFYQNYGRKAIIYPYILKIIDALEKVLQGDITRLLIEAPPRYFKTEIAVKTFIHHALGLNSSAKFIHLTYSDDLALDNSEIIKDTIQSEAYQALFPEVEIKVDSKAKNKWYTTKGGGVLARAAGGSVTGFGAGKTDSEEQLEKEADEELAAFIHSIEVSNALNAYDKKLQFNGAIILDDSIKPEDADSDTIRTRVNERFDSTIRNRVNSRRTPIIVMAQRLHPMDLIGYLKREGEQDTWTVLTFPAVYFDEHGQRQALCPLRHTLAELDAMKKANEVVFERQYMQNPSPKTGLMFPIQDLHFYDPEEVDLTDADFKYLAADPAGSENGDDFAASLSLLKGDRIYIDQVLYNTDGTDLNEIAVREMVLKNKVNFVGVEGVLGWKETAKRIREDLYEKNFQGEFRILQPRTNKHARIANRQSFIRNHFWFRKDWQNFPQYTKFMKNLTTYLRVQEPGKGNKHDDSADNMEQQAAYYEKQFPHLW
jgi:hypothetical protein